MAEKKIRTLADFTDFSDAALWREELATLLTVEDFHYVGDTGEPTFKNNWDNLNPSARGARFYKDPFGRVHLAGMVDTGTSSVVFTLPEGYLPADVHAGLGEYLQFRGGTAGGGSTPSCQVTVRYNGDVAIQSWTTWATIDGVSFRAAD